jgi:hypothetical protein
MAAVTQSATAPALRHVLGDLVLRTFTISGPTGSTLSTGMFGINNYAIQQSTAAGTISLITAVAVNSGTGVLTFTSSGPMVNEVVSVEALKG